MWCAGSGNRIDLFVVHGVVSGVWCLLHSKSVLLPCAVLLLMPRGDMMSHGLPCCAVLCCCFPCRAVVSRAVLCRRMWQEENSRAASTSGREDGAGPSGYAGEQWGLLYDAPLQAHSSGWYNVARAEYSVLCCGYATLTETVTFNFNINCVVATLPGGVRHVDAVVPHVTKSAAHAGCTC